MNIQFRFLLKLVNHVIHCYYAIIAIMLFSVGKKTLNHTQFSAINFVKRGLNSNTSHALFQSSLPGMPPQAPEWNHTYLFTHPRDKATLFTPSATLIIEYYISPLCKSRFNTVDIGGLKNTEISRNVFVCPDSWYTHAFMSYFSLSFTWQQMGVGRSNWLQQSTDESTHLQKTHIR